MQQYFGPIWVRTKWLAAHEYGRARQEFTSLVSALAGADRDLARVGIGVAEFERAFAEYVGAGCAVAVSSCTTALHLALLAVGIEPGDEVLCPSLSFIATANAIMHAGAIPVFVDVDRATYNIDPNCMERAITPRTRAVLLVHQVGLPAALDEICEVARRHRLMVIEDAACAVGAEYHGQRVGLPHAAIACFSSSAQLSGV